MRASCRSSTARSTSSRWASLPPACPSPRRKSGTRTRRSCPRSRRTPIASACGVAAGTSHGDLFDDIAVGIPFEDNTVGDAGAVAAIYGSAGGISATAVRDDQFITQNGVFGLGDIADQEEANDRFG